MYLRIDDEAVLAGIFLLAAIIAPGATGSGDSALGALETLPPSAGTLTAPAITTANPFSITFSGVDDESGLLRVELWYRTAGTSWTFWGNAAAGTFSFAPPGSSTDTYHFQLVAVDTRGNATATPTGQTGTGQASTHYQTASTVGDWWMIR